MMKYCPISCTEKEDEDEEERGENECKDIHHRCPAWSKLKDGCTKIPDMKKYCAKSCNFCGNNDNDDDSNNKIMNEDKLCVNLHDECQFWADSGECEANPNCKRDREKKKEKKE